ncbi:MAG: alanine racemase, partial [Candidatus Wallbacteria bacterium]|nr:alanine racemase [Candidatus Wallbacteria bacterium]
MPALQYGIKLTVADKAFAREVDRVAGSLNTVAGIHVKVDTGMGRIGFPLQSVIKDIIEVSNLKNIKLEGIFSHFSDSDSKDKTFAFEQLKLFQGVCTTLAENGLNIPLKHMANSGAIMDLPVSYMDMVRPGIMLYGYPPSREVTSTIGIEPVMTLISRINFIKRFHPGEPVSYGRTHIVEKETCIAVLPIGYADGYSRRLSGKGRVIIRDHFYPQVGRVTMDQIMIDVGPNPQFGPGEPVIVMGRSSSLIFDAFDMADIIGTISYEVTCNINKRVPRVYCYEETSDCP